MVHKIFFLEALMSLYSIFKMLYLSLLLLVVVVSTHLKPLHSLAIDNSYPSKKILDLISDV